MHIRVVTLCLLHRHSIYMSSLCRLYFQCYTYTFWNSEASKHDSTWGKVHSSLIDFHCNSDAAFRFALWINNIWIQYKYIVFQGLPVISWFLFGYFDSPNRFKLQYPWTLPKRFVVRAVLPNNRMSLRFTTSGRFSISMMNGFRIFVFSGKPRSPHFRTCFFFSALFPIGLIGAL